MAVDTWLQAMRMVSVYTLADAQSYGRDAWLLARRLVSVYSRADAQEYGS